MDCARVEELLPWLLNRSLDRDEAESVRRHLDDCPACRDALTQTRWMAELAARHVPAAGLVDLAAGTPLGADDRVAYETHLASCAACAEELALTQQSWAALTGAENAPSNAGSALASIRRPTFSVRDSPPRTGWRVAALAAGLAAVALAAGAVWQAELASGLRTQLAGEQARQEATIGRLAGEVAELRTARHAAEARAVELGAPQLNAPVVDLLPAELTLRGGDSDELPSIALPRGGRVTLLLYAAPGGPRRGDFGVELRDAAGKIRWSARGLARQPDGGFSLSLPVELLDGERFELAILAPSGDATPLARYRFQVRPPV